MHARNSDFLWVLFISPLPQSWTLSSFALLIALLYLLLFILQLPQKKNKLKIDLRVSFLDLLQMKLVVFLIFLLLLSASKSNGTRLLLEEGSLDSPRLNVQSEKESLKIQEGSGAGGAFQCGLHGHCSGTSRKLMTNAMASSKSARGEEMGVKSDGNTSKRSEGEVKRSQEEPHHVVPPVASNPEPIYTDTLDLADMDYSPAKRKPPIHN